MQTVAVLLSEVFLRTIFLSNYPAMADHNSTRVIAASSFSWLIQVATTWRYDPLGKKSKRRGVTYHFCLYKSETLLNSIHQYSARRHICISNITAYKLYRSKRKENPGIVENLYTILLRKLHFEWKTFTCNVRSTSILWYCYFYLNKKKDMNTCASFKTKLSISVS